MDVRQLRYFVQVAELGSFSRAASHLAVAQSALSRQVHLLETELQEPLLRRNGRGVTVTEAGKRLLAHGAGILQQVERAKQDIADLRGSASGHVAVGLPPSFGRVISAPLVRAFSRHLPAATISIAEGLSTDVVEWLTTGRADLALIYHPAAHLAIEATPLIEQPLYLVGPATSGRRKPPARIALRDLSRFPLLLARRPHAVRLQIESEMARSGTKPSIAYEIDGVAAQLELVSEGFGYAVLPMSAVIRAGGKRRFATSAIMRPKLASTVSLAFSARRPVTALLQRSAELLTQITRAQL